MHALPLQEVRAVPFHLVGPTHASHQAICPRCSRPVGYVEKVTVRRDAAAAVLNGLLTAYVVETCTERCGLCEGHEG